MISPVTPHREPGGFLVPVIMSRTFFAKMFYTYSIVDMSCDALASQCIQHCSDERNFTDSGEMCSGVVIQGLVHALVLAQDRQDNRPLHLIHV